MKYNKNTEEYRERTERLVQERNALKEQLQLLSRKYDANNNNDYDENENQVRFLETKLKLAEKTLKEQIPDYIKQSSADVIIKSDRGKRHLNQEIIKIIKEVKNKKNRKTNEILKEF